MPASGGTTPGTTAAGSTPPAPGPGVPAAGDVVLDTVLVVSPRSVESEIRRRPTFATIRTLGDATSRLLDAADVLEETPGVRVRRYGSLGAISTASIRGSSPGQVEIYLDGIPLNSAQWGVTNLAEIPVESLERIEVYRSGSPAALGSSGIGGVINLVSRPVGTPTTILSASLGSYETWKTSFLNSGRHAGFEHMIAYRQLHSRGDFEFLYDPGTSVLNHEDDVRLRRENNDFREQSILAKLHAPPVLGFRLSAQDEWFLKDGGLAGHGNLIYEEARFENRRHSPHLTLATPPVLGGRARGELTGYHLYRRDRYRNPAGEPGLERNDLVHRSRTNGVKGSISFQWSKAHQAYTIVADRRRESFRPEEIPDAASSSASASGDPSDGADFTRERDLLALSAEDEISLFDDRALVLLAYRYQETEDNFFGRTSFGQEPTERSEPHRASFRGPSLGVRVSLAQGVTAKASRSRYARFPTLFELFGTNGEVQPNPELVPETGVSWDAGVSWVLPSTGLLQGIVDACAFYATRDSLIYFMQNAQHNFKAVNLERAVARGIELSFTARVAGRVRFDGSFTSQDVRHDSVVPYRDDRWLPYVSPRELSLKTTLEAGRFTFRHEYAYFDRYFQNDANTPDRRVAARHLHALGAAVRVWERRLGLDIDVQNLLDEQVTDVFGYPLPGRTLYMTTEITLER